MSRAPHLPPETHSEQRSRSNSLHANAKGAPQTGQAASSTAAEPSPEGQFKDDRCALLGVPCDLRLPLERGRYLWHPPKLLYSLTLLTAGSQGCPRTAHNQQVHAGAQLHDRTRCTDPACLVRRQVLRAVRQPVEPAQRGRPHGCCAAEPWRSPCGGRALGRPGQPAVRCSRPKRRPAGTLVSVGLRVHAAAHGESSMP